MNIDRRGFVARGLSILGDTGLERSYIVNGMTLHTENMLSILEVGPD
jgi:hypothetical protein